MSKKQQLKQERDDKFEQLQNYYHKIAKKADARLRALEAASRDEHYKGILNYAYARAQTDILHWEAGSTRKSKRLRFDRKIPDDFTIAQLQAKIADIEEFMASPTSTKTGIRNIYQQRADTLNKEYGTSFTWRELANFFESDSYAKLSKQYGSRTLIKAIAIIKLRIKPEDIKKANKRVRRLEPSDVDVEIARELMENGYTYENLLGD